MKTRNKLFIAVGLLAAGAVAFSSTGPRFSTHPAVAADLGQPSSSSALEAVIDQPGTLSVETIVAADWQVPLSGLVNLDHPKAAGLKDRDEKIQIYFHVIRHPTRGTYIVDTGVQRAVKADPERSALRGIVGHYMNVDAMQVHVDTASWVEAQREPLAGVFLTHLHMDHVSGMPDIPRGTPIYVGPGETAERHVTNWVVRPVIDRALEGQDALREWQFEPDPDGLFAGVLDVFGDGMLWALSMPGHTAGSTAFVARTPEGPVLMTGDASHTRWGWEHGVEPGSFSHDKPQSARSLAQLRALAERHPNMRVLLGHQPMAKAVSSR